MGPITSKERVLMTFSNQEADRVPLNYLSNPGIHARLEKHFGLKKGDEEGLLQALQVDFRGIGAIYNGPKLYQDIPERGISVDNWGIHTKYIENKFGGYQDFCDFPLMDAEEESVANWLMPDPDDFDYSQIYQQCHKAKDYAITLHCFGDLINGNGMLRGMEQTLIDLITDEPAGMMLADRRFAINGEVARRTLEAAKGGIDIVWLGEDLGSQNSPIISMDIFKKHIRPRFQKLVDMAKAYGARTMIHTCGSSSWAYDEFVNMGIDAVDTLQPEAKNMSPSYLKKTFGGRLAFHGSIRWRYRKVGHFC
jgi:uroporphyrinogen decarboxylase